jgi:hypothetical protein
MFRFTIRDVLWLMVVVGLAVGWFAHSVSWRRFHKADVLKQNEIFYDRILDLAFEKKDLERENSKLRERLERGDESSTDNRP